MEDLGNKRIAALRYEMVKLNERRKDLLIKRLISDYRGDNLKHDKMVGAIAELSSMDEILDRLTRQIGE